MRTREDLIRLRAYLIWEAAGRPAGRHEEHWQQASAEIDAGLEAVAEAVKPAPMPPKAVSPPAKLRAAAARVSEATATAPPPRPRGKKK